MSLGLWGLCAVLLEAGVLAAPADEEWVDPTDMLRYDAASKSMKREPESAGDAANGLVFRYDVSSVMEALGHKYDTDEWCLFVDSSKKGEVQTYARDEMLEDENSAIEQNCRNKLSVLQKEIENLKRSVNYLLDREALNLDPESKLAQLLHSVQQLDTLQDDGSCTFPLEWLMADIVEFRRCISMWLLMLYTYIVELSYVPHSSSHVAPWLLCAVITFLLACILVRRLKKTRKQHEELRENDGQGDDNLPNVQLDDWQPDDEGREDLEQEHFYSLDNLINMPAEVLNPEGLDEQNTGAAEQVLESMADECCDENFEITKMPTAETQPDSRYFS